MNRTTPRSPVHRTLIAVAAMAVIGSACGTDDGASGGNVLPVEGILASEIVIEPDATGTQARLTVDTTIPVACSVVYGVGDSFGLLAVDDDMGGGAHEDHGPTLRGLAPDTTYSYRLQGTDAAGNLYRSQTMTFTTPSALDVPTLGSNVAPDGTVTDVSSEFSSSFAGANAFDGDLGTEWSSAGDGDDASVTIDLGSAVDVVGIGFRSREMGDGTAITTSYEIVVDGEEVLGPFTAGPGLSTTEIAFTGQVLTFRAVETTGGNTGAVDIEIYAAS